MTSKDQPRRLRLRRKTTEPVPVRPEGIQPPVCERLRAARQARGLDFFRIERDTKIRIRFLEAIEDGRFEELPGEIYARGFIRNYAAYLGLDSDVIEAQWRIETGQPAPPPIAPLIKPASRDAIPQPMPEPIAPPRKPARKRAAALEPNQATQETVAAGSSKGLALPQFRLPRPSLPAVRRPKLTLPSLRLPSLSSRGSAAAADDSAGVVAVSVPAIGGPQPMPGSSRRFLLQPAHIVLLAMGAVVLAVTGFFAIQVTRILDYPSVTVTSPTKAVTTLSSDTVQYVLKGTATPGSIIRISWDEREPNTVATNSVGRWQFETSLHSGINQFDISARNEQTNHNSGNVTIILEVPVPTASPTPRLLVVESPTDGQALQSGNVTVKGTTVGIASITITPTYKGPPPTPGNTARPSPTPGVPTAVPTLMPLPTITPTPVGQTPSPRPTATPTRNPSATAGPEAVSVIPTVDGKFSAVLKLTPGVWKLTVVGSDSDGKTTSPVEVTITVAAPALSVTIEVKGGQAWLKVWKDGVVVPGYSKEFPSGTAITIAANESVWIRTGSAVKTYVTVNGVSYGPLGGARSGAWRITATGPPVPSQDV